MKRDIKSKDESVDMMIPTPTKNSSNSNQHGFISRVSLLDDYYPSSSIKSSEFKGFYTAGIIFGMFYLVTDPIIRYMNTGEIFPFIFINSFKKDFFLCLIHWPLYYIFSHIAVVF